MGVLPAKLPPSDIAEYLQHLAAPIFQEFRNRDLHLNCGPGKSAFMVCAFGRDSVAIRTAIADLSAVGVDVANDIVPLVAQYKHLGVIVDSKGLALSRPPEAMHSLVQRAPEASIFKSFLS